MWVVAPGFEGPTLLHVDPKHGEVRDPIAIEQPAITVSMVSAFDGLWYLAPDRLGPGQRLDGRARREPVDHPDPQMVSICGEGYPSPIRAQVGRRRDPPHLLMRVDPSDGVEDRRVADAIDLIAATEEGVWVVDQFDGVVIFVDPPIIGEVWEVPVFGTITRLAVDADYLWLLDQSNGVLTRLSSSTGAEVGQAPVGRGVTDLALGLGAAWLSHADGTISRVDRLTLDVTEFAQVEGGASAIAVDVGRDSIWVDVGPPVVNEA